MSHFLPAHTGSSVRKHNYYNKTQKRCSSHSYKSLSLFFILGALALAALFIQSALIKDLYARTGQLHDQNLKIALIDAVQNLDTDPAVEPQTGRRFIPAAKVVLPPQTEGRIYYRAGETTSLWLIDGANRAQAVHKVRVAKTLDETFQEVGVLQKCNRQITVSFNIPNPKDSEDKLTLKTTKKLKDGRTAYVYQNDCPYGSEMLLRAVDQMESF